MEHNLISIITPVYNGARFVKYTINSVLAQTYTNWELLIVDDGSDDETASIIADFMEHDNRIRYWRNERWMGAALSRNRALREAKGDWIAFLDSDDCWSPEKLECQLDFMIKNGYSFTYHNYEEMNEQGDRAGRLVTGPHHIAASGMRNYCWPGCLTVMYNREKIGLIQVADVKKNNDYAIWLKVIQKADCHLLDKKLAMYRKRSGSISDHGYLTLLKWHYILFRQAEGQNVMAAVISTMRNLVFGVIKKIMYVSSC